MTKYVSSSTADGTFGKWVTKQFLIEKQGYTKCLGFIIHASAAGQCALAKP